MAKRKRRVEEQVERELTRKEIRLRERERARHRTLYTWTAIAIGLALLLIVAGAVYQFAYIPNATAATVAGEKIVTKDFWKRMRLERSQLQNQLVNLEQLQQQFGQQFFASQINQIQSQLQSPFALGVGVLDKMIDERVVAKEAETRGITVTDEEVAAALREEVARGRNAVTEPQATSTAEGAVNATATATLWTPTPTPTIDASLALTATTMPLPTTAPPPASAILSETGYTEGVTQLEEVLSTLNSVNLNEYRQITRDRLLAEKLSKVIGEEKVPATEEQVHARHILSRVMTPTLSITDTGTITAPITPSSPVTTTDATTVTAPISETVTNTVTSPVSETVSNAVTTTVTNTVTTLISDTALVTTTVPVTTTAPVTATVATTVPNVATNPVTTTSDVTATSTLTAGTAITTGTVVTGTVAPTATTTLTDVVAPTPVERSDAEARALAEELRQRILAGEDFATLARQYSDDTGSGAQGGDLDWFGHGRMVGPFDEAAFALPIGEISEPIKTEFGYHIIEILEKDENREKEAGQLEQERQEAFTTWLNEKKTATEIVRPDDLTTLLPRDMR